MPHRMWCILSSLRDISWEVTPYFPTYVFRALGFTNGKPLGKFAVATFFTFFGNGHCYTHLTIAERLSVAADPHDLYNIERPEDDGSWRSERKVLVRLLWGPLGRAAIR